MVRIKIEGEKEKVNEFLKNLKEVNFYFVTAEHEEDNTEIVISETPGIIPEEEFNFRGFISQWTREGLRACLKDFLYLSNHGSMVSFENMNEFGKIYDFLTVNFGTDVEIKQMLDKISENNLNNFEKSELKVYGRDPDFNEEV